MQNIKREKLVIGKADVGSTSARNTRIIQRVASVPSLQQALISAAQHTKIKEVMIFIRNGGVQIKYFHKTGVVNLKESTLEECSTNLVAKMQK